MQVGMVSDADTFSLTFPQGCSTEIKAVLLGAVFLIDFMCELLRAFRPQPSSGRGFGGQLPLARGFVFYRRLFSCFRSPTRLIGDSSILF
jgi:Scramblase.